jgi:hypothetical protein
MRVDALIQRACENVVLVGRDDEAFYGQADALGGIAGEKVAEVAGWHETEVAPVKRA